jgi:hypothetical protein
MGLPVEVNNLMMGSLGGYNVNRSLRFRSSASAYLNRTPASASNRTTWTWSGWVKRGGLGVQQGLFLAGTIGVNDSGFYFAYNDTVEFYTRTSSTIQGYVITKAVYRDPSAWYHLVVVYDSTNATSANRMLIYINGVSQTLTVNNTVPLNTNGFINNNVYHTTGALSDNSATLSGYLAEVNFIDGQALTPSSFGAYDTNGVWQPKKYTGTYGTNGFYLPFSNTTSTTTLVQDSSGNGNNWTPNNISLTAGTTYDSMIDSPTNAVGTSTGIGNYATFNPLVKFAPNNSSYSSGNLGVQQTGGASGSHACAIATIAMSSGKWYAEFSDDTATYDGNRFGILNINNSGNYTNANPYIGWASDGYVIYKNSTNAVKENNGTSTNIGSNWTAGAIISVAVDIDNSKIWWRVNGGAWFGGGDPATGTSPVFTISSGKTYAFAVSPYNNNGVTANFGQRPFSYTPPTGFNALNTYNLPAPSIANGAQYMAATTYTGNGSTQTINNGTNTAIGTSFQPDFVWIKNRAAAVNHQLQNSNAGWQYGLNSNNTNAEYTDANAITGATSSGWSMNNNYNSHNQSGVSYVGWNWKAGAGTTSTNTSGSITSTVSANPTAGFSVVTFTAQSSGTGTVGHGLGVAPSLIITKPRANAYGWTSYHESLGNTKYIELNTTSAASTLSTVWNNTSPTSTVFTLGSSFAGNGTYVAYCFAAVSGYSAFGSYTGNGSADGPFVFTGFRPRWVMFKVTSTTENWYIIDSSRNVYNVSGNQLKPNTTDAEDSYSIVDFTANGFKIRNTFASYNSNSATYIYAAFAENPFKYSRAR